MKKEIRSKLKEKFDQQINDSGIRKAERWMRAAYGKVDWTEYESETGNAADAVEVFCKESLAVPDGIATSNRDLFGGRK